MGAAIVIGVDLNQKFFNVMSPYVICSEGKRIAKHALVVVGYGEYPDGESSFLVRNSWGDQWGDNGHAWLTPSFIKERTVMSLRLLKI